MVLGLHSNSLYLSDSNSSINVGILLFFGSVPEKNLPISLNAEIYKLCVIIKHVAEYSAEADIGSMFTDSSESLKIVVLNYMGHPLSTTTINFNHYTAVIIYNNTFLSAPMSWVWDTSIS